MMKDYNRRHFGTNKLYIAINKNGKNVGSVFAYSKAEASKEFRSKGIKFSKIVKS